MCRSVPQIPAARTARSTCPGAGRGCGSSRNATFPSPRAVFTTACIVVILEPRSSGRAQGRILPHIEADGVIFQKAQQGIALLRKRGGCALRQWIEGCDGERGFLFLALHPPGARHSSIHKERGRNAAILRSQDEAAM